MYDTLDTWGDAIVYPVIMILCAALLVGCCVAAAVVAVRATRD